MHSGQKIVETAFLDQMEVIDWQAIFQRLINSDEGEKLSSTQAAIAIWRYQLFLYLIQKYPHVKMVPNQEIDAVLHVHIANNHKFATDGQKLFSTHLQHVSEFGLKGEAERQEWLWTFARTQTLFEQNFGIGAMGNSIAACCEILYR
ncbi:hypothetical protein Cal7507_3983 [Calothrix sp. PCC 7507]|nr:hypothetical protein Cal7507_3983 [Calothrix sp. PCC 7507]